MLVLLGSLGLGSYASEARKKTSGDAGTMPTVVSYTAAMNGVYRYTVDTSEVTFLKSQDYALTRSSLGVSPQFSPSPSDIVQLEPRVVTSPDGRWKVTDASGKYANTVLLEIKFPTVNPTWATGWVIGPNAVASAGHCVFNYNYGWAEWIRIYPGTTGGSQPYGTTHATNYWAGGEYVANQGNYNIGVYDDWSVIQTEIAIGNNTGWLGISTANSLSDVSGKTFQTNGYPSDLDNSSVSIPNKWMYSAYGTFTNEKFRPKNLPTMYMDLDFAGGQSGSAIYRYLDDYGYCAQAIGVAGDTQTIVILINNWLFEFFTSFR